MSRRSKRKRKRGGRGPEKGPRETSPATLRKLALEELESGRVRQALNTAKALLKAAPGPESEEVLIRVRLARARELAGSGLPRDALQLLEEIGSAFPRSRDDVHDASLAVGVALGRIDGVLREFSGADPEGDRREDLLGLLRDGVTDPRVVAESEALPPEHPLRREAKAAIRVFEGAVSKPGEDGDLGDAEAISRQSPFFPWVALARAVRAAYREDAGSLERLAGLLPESSAPARLLPLLRALARGEPGEGLSFAARRLLEEIRGESDLADDIRKLEGAFQREQAMSARRLGASIRRRLEAQRPRLLPDFARLFCREWYAAEFDPSGLLDVLRPDPVQLPDVFRYCALALELTEEHGGALECWDVFLERRGAEASPVEQALVRLRQAELAERAESPGPPDLADLDFLDLDADALLNRMYTLEDAEPPPDPLPYYEAAAAALPSDRTFEPLIQYLAEEDPRAAEAAALRWHEEDPTALAPLFHLVRAAEGRRALRKALRWLEMAEKLEPSHPEVTRGRFRLLLAGAADRIRRAKPHLARKDVAALEETPRGKDPNVRCLLHGLSWLAAEDPGARASRREALAKEIGEEGAALLLGQMRREVRAGPSVPRVQIPGPPPPAEAARALARVGKCFGTTVGWKLEPVPDWSRALREGLEQGLEPADGDLESLCRVMTIWEEDLVLYLLSGQGLRRSGPLRHRFLLHRARSLLSSLGSMDRRQSCLMAALTLARRSSDPGTEKEALAELSDPFGVGQILGLLMGSATQDVAEPLPAEELAHILEFEANAPLDRSLRRKRRRRRAKRERGLFDL